MATLSQPTAGELIGEIRSDLNQPSATNSFWSDEELLMYINRGVRRFFMEAVHYMEGQFTTTTDLNIVSGTEGIDLPSDFFKIKVLWKRTQGGTSYIPLHYRNNLSRGYSTQGLSGGDSYFPDYEIRAQQIILQPTPSFSETSGLKLEYVQFPDTMLSGGDDLTAEVSPIFRDLIIAYAVWQAKKKESLTSGVDVTAIAKDHLNDQYLAFKEIIVSRSADPTAVRPFNPEAE